MAPAVVKDWVEKAKAITPGLNEEGPNWKPTSNERNNMMLKEARTYSYALISLHRDLSSWDKAVRVGLNSISTLLKAPLPRTFDEAASGAAFPVSREHRLVASDVPTEVLGGAAAQLREKLSRDVLKPLEQWLEAYKKIREDNEKVEELRRELDARRKSHAAVQYKYDKLTADPTPKDNPKTEEKAANQLEASQAQLATEEDKTTRMAQRYADAEAHVFQAVYALIQDVHVLRDYAAAAITLMQNTFTTSLRAFQDGAAALEQWKAAAGGGLGSTPLSPVAVNTPTQSRASEGLDDGRAALAYASNKAMPGTPTTPPTARSPRVV